MAIYETSPVNAGFSDWAPTTDVVVKSFLAKAPVDPVVPTIRRGGKSW